jgi:hypothetical protein
MGGCCQNPEKPQAFRVGILARSWMPFNLPVAGEAPAAGRGKIIRCEDLSEAVLVRWKKLLIELRRKNRAMTCEDSLIAATALHHGHIVATHNRRHFEPAGVQLVDPFA